jgi:hypothetical protein
VGANGNLSHIQKRARLGGTIIIKVAAVGNDARFNHLTTNEVANFVLHKHAMNKSHCEINDQKNRTLALM